MTRRRKRILAIVAIILLTILATGGYLSSKQFSRRLLARIQEEVLRQTGMRLDAAGLAVQVWRGRVTLKQATLHGTEPANDQPLLQVKEVRLDAGFGTFTSRGLHLRAIAIDEPRIHLTFDEKGRINIPAIPEQSGGKDPLEQILDLKLGHLEITHGHLLVHEASYDFSLRADEFSSRFDYLPASRAYQGNWRLGRVAFLMGNKPPLAASGEIRARVSREGVSFDQINLTSGERNRIQAKGEFKPSVAGKSLPARLDLDVESTIDLDEASVYLPIPFRLAGMALYKGALLFEAGRGWELHGNTKLSDGFYRDASTRLGPVQATSQLDVLPNRVVLSKLHAGAFDGKWDGAFQWDAQEGWKLDGDLEGIRTERILSQLSAKPIPWSGRIGGPVRASGGKQPITIEADLRVAAAQGPSPLEGLLAISYEEAGGKLYARDSYLALPNTRVQFAGDLRGGLRFEFRSQQFEELKPALTLAGLDVSKLPLAWDRGTLQLSGIASGDLKALRVKAQAEATGLRIRDFDIQSIKTRLGYSPELLQLDEVDFRSGIANATGNLRLALEQGRIESDSPLSGSLQATVESLRDAGKMAGAELPLDGGARVTMAVRGSLDEPAADGTLSAPRLVWEKEEFQQNSAIFTASRRDIKVPEWETRLAGQPLKGALQLRAGGNDWKIGSGTATIKAEALSLDRLQHFRDLQFDGNASITTDLQSDFSWSPEGVAPSKLDGRLLIANIRRFNRPVGQLEFTSRTTAGRANLTAVGNVRQLPIKGDATIQLGVRLDTELRLQLPRLDFPVLAQLLSKEELPQPLPYVGGAEASVYFRGPLVHPEDWDGTFTIPQLQLAPNKDYVRESLLQVSDVVLRNEGPVVLRFRKGEVSAQGVRLVAKDTNITAGLTYRLADQRLNGDVKGSINLAILSTIQPELLTRGIATLNTTIAGTAADPQINGKLSFNGASFYLRNVITGLDKVNGTILFDRNRATIDSLRAQTGGGELQLSGFIGVGRIISYRLQAQASQVRIRYPEGVSTAANASLSLTGTTQQSILTGNVSILRSTIGQIDTSQLSIASGGMDAPAQNEFLRNLQFDVRVDTVQNAEFSTTLTKNIKGEVSLRLRGTPQRPILLGRVLATQGEINFFGASYTINRGEVQFANPLRIEPVVNLDLETRVRGITINMNFSGPANKLNLTYRSDPPLQSSEILALLTVGRNPNSSSSILQVPAGQAPGNTNSDSSLIVGAAVSAGINGRLQRFFGISRVRLDPQLTGIDNVPQARLTLEQQVSRDVTLTYITNLNRTQQQIVRVDWDISRTWSVVAVRDENGIFGLDLFFRKRSK